MRYRPAAAAMIAAVSPAAAAEDDREGSCPLRRPDQGAIAGELGAFSAGPSLADLRALEWPRGTFERRHDVHQRDALRPAAHLHNQDITHPDIGPSVPGGAT